MTDSESRIQVGDVQLRVRVDGNQNEETLLFLHGLTNSSTAWRWIIPRLGDRYRLVSFDFRGHGLSDRAERYTSPDFLLDATAVCEQIAGAGSVVIAHSWGGLSAAALAQRRPDLVRGLFLEDPLLVDPGVRTDLLGEDGVYIREVFDGTSDFLALIRKWQEDGLSVDEATSMLEPMATPQGATFSELYFPESIRAMAEYRLQFDLRILEDFADAQQSRAADPIFDPQKAIEVPGFLLSGDPTVPGVRTRPLDVERLRDTSPSIGHRTVHGAGHFIHDERAFRATVAETLTGFLLSLRE